jgi:hypothetical protein
MDGAANLFAAQGRNHPFDLPPVTEADNIAGVAAQVGEGRSLITGIVAEAAEKLGSVGEGHAATDEGCVHALAFTSAPLSGLPTKIVNAAFTMLCLFVAGAFGRLLSWRGMVRRNTHSGGIFLTVGILAGFGWGVTEGAPMKGVLIGTGIGIAAALLVWLFDRRR